MIDNKPLYRIQISAALILGMSSNLLQSSGIKILNTEKIVLSIGDIGDETNDDLEIIRPEPKNDKLDKKLNSFHKVVKMIQVAQKRKKKVYMSPYPPDIEISYPDSPYEIAANREELNKLERRRKKKRNRFVYKPGFEIAILPSWKSKNSLRGAAISNEWGTEHTKLTTPKEYLEADVEYDYLAKDYQDLLIKSKKINSAYKYTDEGKPEENFKEVIQKITDIKTPKNCTNVRGIGVQALACLAKEVKNKEITTKKFFNQLSIILLVWLAAYLIIVVPLWCTKGWCCCCFRCSFCFPNKTIKDIQKYISENPPGVYINSKGEEVQYNSNLRETELYEHIKKLVADF